MRGLAIGLTVVLVCAVVQAVTIDTVPVGNAGNDPDDTGYGSVGDEYRIGKYEVTAGQYCEFLNAVAKTDPYGLYNPDMWSNADGCKIERYTGSGTPGDPYKYRVAPDYANRPVNFVSFWDACRFANWLHNGQGSGDTEAGAYTLTPGDIANNTVTRNANWKWAVTTEDEWYKAAYHKNDGRTGNYWDYPTGSDTAPGQDMSDVSGNNANYWTSPHAYPIDSGMYYTTVVGEFQNSESPYGTFDQGGNVWEWNEAIPSGMQRGIRGGAFSINDLPTYLQASYRTLVRDATFEGSYIGFRISEVPEPATLSLLALAGLAMIKRRK